MKFSFLLLLLLCTLLVCDGQNDTSKIYNSSQLRMGFYKTYEEYLNNAPSFTPDVTLVYLIKSRLDSTITAAEYKLKDPSAAMPEIWGFCDGRDVFIRHRVSPFKVRYAKAEYIGKNPFFLFWKKEVYAIGPPLLALATAAGTAAIRPVFYLMFINPKGKITQAKYSTLKKLFSVDPDLLKRFKSDNYISDRVMAKYLIEFNEKYIIDDEK